MNQHEIVQKTTLLRRDGSLAECGWARHPYFAYRRDYVKGPLWLRLKEWDYYAILDERAGFWCALTYSDLGYAGLFAVAYVDLTLGKAVQCDSIRLLSRHRSGLGTSSTDDGSSTYCDKDGKLTLTFIRRGDLRHIIFNAPDLVLPDGRRGLLGDFSLYQNREKESINIASSWAEDRKAFYLNEKVVGMVEVYVELVRNFLSADAPAAGHEVERRGEKLVRGTLHAADARVATEQKRRHPELGTHAPALTRELEAARHAKKELRRTHAEGARGEVVPALVDEHEHGEHEHAPEDDPDHVENTAH